MTSPAPSSPLQIPDTWSAVASGYAEETHEFSELYAVEALRRVPLAPGDEVLDVATGPGRFAFLAAERAKQVVAVDFSPGMIEELERRKARDGAANVSAAVMDAQALDFAEASFDAAFCLFGFMFFPDRARAYGEIRRVLRPGGRFCMATWGPIERRPMMQVAFEAFAEVMPELPRPQKGDLQVPAECAREVEAAGFRDVVCAPFVGRVNVESPEHYLRVTIRSGAPFVLLKKKLGDERWADVERRLLGAVERRLSVTGLELEAEALFTSGVR